MQIRRMTATFGKLHAQNLALAPGLNVITAPNESGKSTWTHFLYVMFYGLNTRERGALADKNRFLPWDGSNMQGRMDIADNSGAYVIARTASRSGAPLGEFHCTYADTATEVPGITGQNCGEHFLGVPGRVYERSAFITQNSLIVEQDNELERRIVSLITTGEEDISYSDSFSRLKKQLNHRRSNSKMGQIPRLEREIEALQQQLDALGQLSQQAGLIQDQLAQLQSQRQELLRQQEQWVLWDAQQTAHACQQAENDAQAAQSRAAFLDEQVAALPDASELSRLSVQTTAAVQAQNDAQTARQTAQQAQQAADIAQAKLEAHPFYPRTETQLQHKRSELLSPDIPDSSWLVQLLFCLAGLAVGITAIAGWDAHLPQSYLLLGVALACFSIAIVFSFRHRVHRRQAVALQTERTRQLAAFDDSADAYRTLQKEAAIALDRAQQAKATTERLSQKYREQEMMVLWQIQQFRSTVTDLSGAQRALIDAQKCRTNAAKAHQNAENATLRAKLLCEHLPNSPAMVDGAVFQPPLSKAQLQEDLQQTETAIATAQTRLDTLTGQLRTLGDSEDLNAQLARHRQQLSRNQQEYNALTLAMDALSQANITLQNRFSPALGARAAEIFRQITGEKYTKVLLNRDFSLSVEMPNDPTMHSAQLLSQGAADQLYLAVRLAICDMVLPSENAAPLILDDALVSFDDERLHAALDYLVQEGERRQILLFSCQKREREYLAGRKGVTFLSL
ncbi:MAG: AAA family ATPase [Clostridiales bacterium]|nr:AAA family ATPase [Candidatus Cacconaster stercorequi]